MRPHFEQVDEEGVSSMRQSRVGEYAVFLFARASWT